MQIKSLQYIGAIGAGEDFPELKHPQIAFVGRSNVGKSSLINTLAQKKDLAKPSSTAGFTKRIHFFLVNKQFFLVDLPGYGYAQGSASERKNIMRIIEWYLTHSTEPFAQVVVQIIDAKVGVTEHDKEMLAVLHQLGKNVIIVANKIDKLKKNEVAKQMKKIETDCSPYPVIPLSTQTKAGIPALTKELYEYIGK